MAVIKEIAGIEEEVAKALEAAAKEVEPLDKQLAAEVQKLGERRHALVSGKALPTAAELEGCGDADAVAAAGGPGSGPKGCPYFWASVLANCDAVSQHVTGRDRLALEYLRDVRRVGGRNGEAPGIELAFDPKNPYFSNKVLRRAIGGDVDEGTDIDWKDGHDLTVKEVTKKSKKGKKGKGKGGGDADAEPAARTRRKPCPSFFRFFEVESAGPAAHIGRLLAPEIEEADGSDDEEQDARAEAKREADAELLAALRGPVVLRATHLYLEGPLQGGGGSGGGGARGGSSDDDDDYEMVAGGSGAVEDLPAHTRAVVAALGSEQRDLDAAVSRYRAARAAAAEGVNAKLKALYAKRRAALAAAGAAGNAPPRYWLRVLRSVDAAALAITRRDAAVLQHLVDVRYEVRAPEGGASSGSSTGGGEQQVHAALELEFSDACPQLAPRARTLRKEYRFTVLGAGAAASGGPALRLLSSKVAVAPEWAPGTRDPTHRKARDGRLRPAASVFQLFRAQGGGGKWAFNLTGPEKEVQAEASELEVELLEELQGRALPRTAEAYLGMPDDDDVASDGDDGASSDDDDDEGGGGSDGGSDDDEGAAARRAALKHSKEHGAAGRPWWKPSKGAGLMLLLLLILAAQYLSLILHFTG